MTARHKETRSPEMITISELASEFGITQRAIRYYEEIGLLSPHRNTPTSHRLYSDRDRARLKLILRGKRFGYTLSELTDILELYEADPTQRRQILRTLEYGMRHIQEINERIQELEEIREEMVERAIHFLKIMEKGAGDRNETPPPDCRRIGNSRSEKEVPHVPSGLERGSARAGLEPHMAQGRRIPDSLGSRERSGFSSPSQDHSRRKHPPARGRCRSV
jgi:DNA-binding transcriptional MerR regulator